MCTHVRTAHSMVNPYACEVDGCQCDAFRWAEASYREEGETLIERAAAAAMDAAWEGIGDAANDETMVVVVIQDIDAPPRERAVTAAKKRHSQATVPELMAVLLAESMALARSVGKDLKLIPVSQDDPRRN